MEPILIDGKEVARLLNVGRTTIHKLVKSGKLPMIKLGRLARYRVEDVKQLASGSANGIRNN